MNKVFPRILKELTTGRLERERNQLKTRLGDTK